MLEVLNLSKKPVGICPIENEAFMFQHSIGVAGCSEIDQAHFEMIDP